MQLKRNLIFGFTDVLGEIIFPTNGRYTNIKNAPFFQPSLHRWNGRILFGLQFAELHGVCLLFLVASGSALFEVKQIVVLDMEITVCLCVVTYHCYSNDVEEGDYISGACIVPTMF